MRRLRKSCYGMEIKKRLKLKFYIEKSLTSTPFWFCALLRHSFHSYFP